MTDIYINCSDISSFIGQNKWDYWTSFIRLWKRVDSKAYAECEIMSKDKGKSIQNDKIIELKETLGENFMNETLKKTTNKQEMINNINASHEIIEKLDVSDEKKTELKVNVESFVNTNFGTHNEIGALELYEMKYKVILDKSQQFIKIPLGNSDESTGTNWYICGKVDGILKGDKSKVIEVKTRTRCFFKEVRDYENTQMQVYMHMLNMDAVDLVEYMPQNRVKIKITPIVKNEKTIQEILRKLNVFATQFTEFLNYNIEQKYEFFSMDLDDKKTFLTNLYLSKMNLSKIKK
jgi:hypothetical protein